MFKGITLQKITINDVAKHAGVSKKTVSRVLNDEPNVSEDTKLKVKAVFDELGYYPSPQARGLASNQSFLLGLVYDNPNDSYVADVQAGALNVCADKGYHLLIHPCDRNSETLISELVVLVTHSRLDGLVLTPPFSDMQPLLDELENKSIAYVRIGSTLTKSKSPSVIGSDTDAAFEMTNHLISLGHTKIGFIKGHPDHKVSQQRFDGYCRALKSGGIKLDDQCVQEGFFTFQSGEEAARRLLSLSSPPTAIFASNDLMAAGVFKVASQKNINIPFELSVAGFDNAPISEYIWPSMTTVKQPVREKAAQALLMLISTIRNIEISNRHVQLNDNLVIRESTAPFRQ